MRQAREGMIYTREAKELKVDMSEATGGKGTYEGDEGGGR